MSVASEAGLELEPDFDPARLRLAARARWMPLTLALATLLPYEVIEGHPQFFWDLVGELPPAGLAAYGAPLLAAAAIGLARWRLRGIGLAWAVLAALGTCAAWIRLGADASAWEITALPESFSRRAALPLVALALTAAGAGLMSRAPLRRVGRFSLLAAVAVAVAFYLLPGRGEAPSATVGRLLPLLWTDGHWQLRLGFGVVSLLMLWPLLVTLAGLWHLARPPRDPDPLVAVVALYGLPLMLAMLVLRGVAGGAAGWDVFAAVGGIAVLVGVVGLLAAAAEVALGGLGSPAARPAGIAVAVACALAAGQWALARPPRKGVSWELKASTEAGDVLFRDLLPLWNVARYDWDQRTRATTGGQALIEVKARGNAAIQAAKALDPGLGQAVEDLVRAARELNIGGRTWAVQIEAVNAATRAAGLPYTLDPTVISFTREGARRRHFRMRSFRVLGLRRFTVAGADYATLHVERLDRLSGGQPLLGFSRDHQPFALVDLAQVRGFEERLRAGAEASPPSCGTAGELVARIALRRCGVLLARFVETHAERLGEDLIRLTDRHELQHQVDGPHLPLAGAVLAALPGRSPALQTKVNRELSAYTAELTAEDLPPALGILHLAPFALSGGDHHLAVVARLSLSALAGRPLTTATGAADLTALVEAIETLVALPDDALRARAREAWATLYGAPLAEVGPAATPATGTSRDGA